MSKYTMELRYIENLISHEELVKWFSDYELTDFLTDEEIAVIETRGTWSKEKLAEKMIRHFYTNEIGFETIGLFHLNLKSFLDETMEEYLPLIYSASIKYDPLVNVDFTETYNANNQTENESKETRNLNSKTDGNNLSINSDTPQGQINKSDILNGSYASSTTLDNLDTSITDTGSVNNNANVNQNEHYVKTTKGNSGVSATAQKMIVQYRDNIRAIDREIIEKARPLFMGIL